MLNKLLLFILSFTVSVPSFATDFEAETYFFDYVSDGLCYTVTNKDKNEVVVKGTTLTDKVFEKKYELSSLRVPSTVVLGNRTYFVTGIDNYAFRNCTNLSAISIDNGVSFIGYASFEGCSNLTRVDLPETLLTIDDNAFKDCGKLLNVALPSNLKSVGDKAFMNCSMLRSMTFSALVAEVDASVFYGCHSLSVIVVDANNPNMLSVDGVLYNKVQTTLICCPDARTSALILPRSVAFISYKITDKTKANCISCYSDIPPVMASDETVASSISVFVPKLAVETYKQNPSWARFNIHPF